MKRKLFIAVGLALLLLTGCSKEKKEESPVDNGVVNEVHSMDDLIADPDFDFSMMHDIEIKIVNKKMAYECFDIYTDNPANGGTAIITNAFFDKDGVYLYTMRIPDTQSSLYIQSKNAEMQSKSLNIVNKKVYYSYD